jgi:tubulin alpha
LYVPRSVYVDFDQSVINQVRTGPLKKLFKPRSLFCPKNSDDTANVYARGYYTIGKEIIEDVMNEIRKQAETCSGL